MGRYKIQRKAYDGQSFETLHRTGQLAILESCSIAGALWIVEPRRVRIHKTRNDNSTAVTRRKIGAIRQRQRIPKWLATVDEDGHYSLAVAL